MGTRGNHPIDCVMAFYERGDELVICPVAKGEDKADGTDFDNHWGGVVGKGKRKC